jgi:VWFA-related protein
MKYHARLASLALVGHAGALWLCVSLCPSVELRAQTPPSQRVKEAESTDVTAIVIDVVVRDRAGNPVTDLAAEDFELLEDGVQQDIGSFTVMRETPARGAGAKAPAGDTTAPKATAPASTPAPGASPEVIALVFDQLSPDARDLARKAALAYVGDGKVSNNIIAVFGLDLSLTFYQPFSRDADLIRQGIQAAGARATTPYASNSEQRQSVAQQLARSTAQLDSLTGNAAGGTGQAIGAAATDQQFAAMQLRMLQQFDGLERDQKGYATSNGLMAIVSAMRAIPGRKSVVLFSEGLSIPEKVQSQFISVIDAANRANVSIYPMDAAGLRTESTTKETREGIASASLANLDRNPSRDQTGEPMMAALERNEALLRADPHSGLGMLADQTGGFLIANTNDLRAGFSRIDTDLRNHYVLTYVPKNTRFDGGFREVDVKVRRPDVRVRARKGYFAVRTPPGAPVLAHEVSALAALEQTPVPNAFPARAIALRFPEASRLGLSPILVNVPTSGLTFHATTDKKQYTSDFVVLVRLRDQSGQVLEKVSQRYELQGPIEQMDRAKLGDVLFYREPVLAPGVYSMETVVYDALSSKATVRLSTVDVDEVDPSALRLSSLMAIRRSETVPENERLPGSPLYVGDQLLYPGMGEPLSKASAKELAFYFVAYPVAGGPELTATLALVGSGKRLAEAPLQLSPPDANGRIAQVGRIPIDPLAPGNYDLHVTVQQGEQKASRHLSFRVQP